MLQTLNATIIFINSWNILDYSILSMLIMWAVAVMESMEFFSFMVDRQEQSILSDCSHAYVGLVLICKNELTSCVFILAPSEIHCQS